MSLSHCVGLNGVLDSCELLVGRGGRLRGRSL